MEKKKVNNLIIVDASGSMGFIYNQALTGINETIATIKSIAKEPDAPEQYLTILSFASGNEKLEYVYDNTPIEKVKKLGKKDYVLRGSTALYDAIGDSVLKLKNGVGKEEKTLVTIITDGCENDSQRWDYDEVKKLIDKLSLEGWVFTYIGANQDVQAEASKIGINNHLEFKATVQGTREMFEREQMNRRNWNRRVSRNETNLGSGYFEAETNQERRISPDHITGLKYDEIFVFGSNIMGQHNGGASLAAKNYFGAKNGIAEGIQGQSYAIPTTGCSKQITEDAVNRFIEYAKQNSNLKFLVTAIGCGNGGWDVREMAKLFVDAKHVVNIYLPSSFYNYI